MTDLDRAVYEFLGSVRFLVSSEANLTDSERVAAIRRRLLSLYEDVGWTEQAEELQKELLE